MSRDFDDILNDCLERVARGEGLQQCMESYPEYREELAPLLGVRQRDDASCGFGNLRAAGEGTRS